MKLNADIVYSNLKEYYDVSMSGPKTNDLTISRPEFYMDNDIEFLANHLYLCTVEHLPLRPNIQKNVVLVVIGENTRLSYYREHACVIIIKNKADFFKVHKILESIFDKYYNWEKELFDIFLESANIQDIVDSSFKIFNRSIFIIDGAFNFIAYKTSSKFLSNVNPSTEQFLNQDVISTFLTHENLMIEKHGPMLLNVNNYQTLCVNLFNQADKYVGCLVIDCQEKGYAIGEDSLADFMAKIVEKAFEKNPSVKTEEQSSIKYIVELIVDEMPMSSQQKLILNAANKKNEYVCVSFHYQSQVSQLPTKYICNQFESIFNDAFAFEKSNSIIGFINVNELNTKHSSYHLLLNEKLNAFTEQMMLVVGISNSFNDFYLARIHYLQAESAIENGMVTNHQGRLFYFESYALMEMVVNSVSGLPIETYYPKGLKKLFEHDKNSPVSYIETLKVFLNCNMSYTTASKELFVHRSTLIDRIERIESELGMDLNDPDNRLHILVILKAIEIEDMINYKDKRGINEIY